MNDSWRRAIRGLLDIVPAVLVAAGAALAFPGLADALRLSPEVLASAGVVLGALLLFFSKLRNKLEDLGVIPALLKAPASDGENPVPDGGRHEA